MPPFRHRSSALRSPSTISNSSIRSSTNSLSSTCVNDTKDTLKSALTTSKQSLSNAADHQQKPDKIKLVRFGSLEIIEFNTILGDNPSVSNGPALALGFTQAAIIRMDVRTYEDFRCNADFCTNSTSAINDSIRCISQDLLADRSHHQHSDDEDSIIRPKPHRRSPSNNELWYYSTHRVPRRYKDDLKLSLCERADILLCEGYTTREIIYAGRIAEQCQKEREQSFRNQKWDPIQEFFEEHQPWNLAQEQDLQERQQRWNDGIFSPIMTIFCPIATIAAN